MKITLRQQCNVRRAIHAVLLAEINKENRDSLTQNLFADTFMIQPNFSSILRKKMNRFLAQSQKPLGILGFIQLHTSQIFMHVGPKITSAVVL